MTGIGTFLPLPSHGTTEIHRKQTVWLTTLGSDQVDLRANDVAGPQPDRSHFRYVPRHGNEEPHAGGLPHMPRNGARRVPLPSRHKVCRDCGGICCAA